MIKHITILDFPFHDLVHESREATAKGRVPLSKGDLGVVMEESVAFGKGMSMWISVEYPGAKGIGFRLWPTFRNKLFWTFVP